MASVFISYARKDAAKAKVIARALEQASFDVWFDERLHSGSEFSREIEQALASAAAVVVLWSASAVESAWVRDEAAEGRDSGRLIAVVIDDCRPPIGFRQFHATDLSRWSGRGRPKQLDELIAAVARKAGEPRTEPPRHEAPQRRRPRSVQWIAALLALSLLVGAAWFVANRSKTQKAATPSVALLAFTADSSDADSRKLAAATRDSIAQTLSQSAFAVRTIDAADVKEAASDFVISGRVTSTPDKFVTTVRMEDAAHHVVVFSRQFEANRAEVWELPERIGAQVASQLSWTAPMIAMERRHPSDPAVIKTLLQSSTAGMRQSDELQDYEGARRLAIQAPNSPLALNQLAMNTAFALDLLPASERVQAVATARQAADRAIAIAPEQGGNYIPWCVLHSEQRRVPCEDRLRAGMRADPDNSFANWFLSKLLNDVGRNREALELAKLSLAHDQYMPYKIGHALRMLEVAGQPAEANDLYGRAKRWWPKEQIFYWNRFVGFAQRADFDGVRQLDHEIQKETGSTTSGPALASAVRANSASGVRSACASRKDDSELVLCMLAFAQVGDLDAAYALADRVYPTRRGRTPQEEERIWLENPAPMPVVFLTGPGAAALRRDARFVPLAERLGLLEYWRSGRPPDFCRPPQPEAICSRLLRR